MRITPRIALVGSGQLGMHLSDPFDCNVYLLDCGSELVLIDAGAGRNVERLLEIVRDDGFDPARIRHVLLTHAHADHAGGCAELHERLGLEVWASAEAAKWVRGGDEHAISLDAARAAGIYPAAYRFRACPVAHVVEDGMPFTIGDATLTPLATSGHADGHIAFLLHENQRRCLFIGDLLLCDGRVLLQATYDCRPQLLAQSLLRLNGMQIDALFPGHLHFCLDNAQAQIDTANVYTRKLLLPLG